MKSIIHLGRLLILAVSVTCMLSACQSADNQPTGSASPHPDGIPSDHPMLPLSTLLAPPSFLAPQVSPDGTKISWIAPLNGTPNLYVADIDNLDSARPVTRHTDDGVRATDVSSQVMYRWHYDSKHLIYPKDYGGDENWDIHVVNVETATDRNLTPIPDKSIKIMAYGRSRPNQALVSVDTFGASAPDVYRLNLKTGELVLHLKNDGSLGYVADNDLRLRMNAEFNKDGGIDFHKYGEGGKGERIYRVGADDLPAFKSSASQKIIRVSADNERIYLYDAQGRDKAALVSLNLDSGAIDIIAEDNHVDIGGVIYHPVDYTVQGYATNWTRNSWTAVDDAVADDFETISALAEGDWTIVSRSDDDSKWVVRYMLSHKPIEYYLYDRPNRSGKRIFSETPQLEGLKLSKLHPYVLTTDDGYKLVSYVMLPPWTDPDEDGRPDSPVPVIVLVHGGPSDERAIFAFGPLLHWLANRGYGILYVNFRGSAGFGKAYMNAQKMEWGGRMHQDVLDQVEWAIDEGIADPNKVAILGGSYGGYEALVGMTMTPDVFACGISVVGPSNLEIFMPHWDEDHMGGTIGDPRTEEGRAFLRSRSPVNFAHQTKSPVLIAQGANDSRVPQEQSEIVVEKMQEAGVEVTYLLYPDEGHGFLRPANTRSFNAVLEVFLGRCLGGRYEPIEDQIEESSLQVPVGVNHIAGLAEALGSRTNTGMPEHSAVEVDSAILRGYVGSYKLEQYDVNIEVSWNGEQLEFAVPGQPAAVIYPMSDTEFFTKVSASTIGFFESADGGVSHLVLYSEGTETRADRVD